MNYLAFYMLLDHEESCVALERTSFSQISRTLIWKYSWMEFETDFPGEGLSVFFCGKEGRMGIWWPVGQTTVDLLVAH